MGAQNAVMNNLKLSQIDLNPNATHSLTQFDFSQCAAIHQMTLVNTDYIANVLNHEAK
jgi:hypothetical protein